MPREKRIEPPPPRNIPVSPKANRLIREPSSQNPSDSGSARPVLTIEPLPPRNDASSWTTTPTGTPQPLSRFQSGAQAQEEIDTGSDIGSDTSYFANLFDLPPADVQPTSRKDRKRGQRGHQSILDNPTDRVPTAALAPTSAPQMLVTQSDFQSLQKTVELLAHEVRDVMGSLEEGFSRIHLHVRSEPGADEQATAGSRQPANSTRRTQVRRRTQTEDEKNFKVNIYLLGNYVFSFIHAA